MSENFQDIPTTFSRFEPRTHKLPQNFAILLGTPWASEVYRGQRHGDTGRRASRLANAIGATIVAYQDLGPASRVNELLRDNKRMRSPHFMEYATTLGHNLATFLRAQDISRVAFRIHSGNGPLGTQLALDFGTSKDRPAVTHMAVSDPAGLTYRSYMRTYGLFRAYRKGPEKNMPEDDRIDLDDPRTTFRSAISDLIVRGPVWCTDRSKLNLLAIASTMPNTAVLTRLPEYTFNGTPAHMQQIASELNKLAHDVRGEYEAPFVAEYAPNEFHGTTFDHIRNNSAFTLRALSLQPFTD